MPWQALRPASFPSLGHDPRRVWMMRIRTELAALPAAIHSASELAGIAPQSFRVTSTPSAAPGPIVNGQVVVPAGGQLKVPTPRWF
jgi:hypothetical protein